MPRIDWLWLIIGIAIGTFVVPRLHMLGSLGTKKA